MRAITGRNARYATVWALMLVWSAPLLAAEEPATLQWAARVELGMSVSGTVQAVEAQEGERVKRGQPLARLDARGFEAAVARSKARVASREEEFAEAQREVERAEELYERTVLSDHELSLAQIAFARAQAELASAQADLVQGELNLEYSVLRAPFDARVVRRMVEPGQVVASDLQVTPLFVLAAADRMVARAHVPESAAIRLAPNASIPVRVGAARYEGAVRNVGLEPVEPGIFAVDVLFSYDPERGVLRAGQSARVDLP